MKKLLVAVAALGLVVAACGNPADVVVQAPGTEGRTAGISVTGQGRVSGAPDTLTLTIGVQVLRDSVGAAVADAAGLADGLVEALTAEGVESEDIRTVDYSIYPEYDYSQNRQELIGFRVSNQVEVVIRDLERAGEIVDAATARTGDEVVVSGLAFSLENNEGLLAAARAAAWADVEAKASQLAGLAGVSLGDPITIVESLDTAPPVQPFAAFEEAAALDRAITPIEAGQLAVTVTLQVDFGLGS